MTNSNDDLTDPYENIYTVIKGTKHFILFPPTEGWCLQGSLVEVKAGFHETEPFFQPF
jgi:hypothetical protein